MATSSSVLLSNVGPSPPEMINQLGFLANISFTIEAISLMSSLTTVTLFTNPPASVILFEIH